MNTNHTDPDPGVAAEGAGGHRPEALAEAAWWHLLNRHQLAAVLDQLGATTDDPARLRSAVAYLARRAGQQVPTHDPIPDSSAGEPQ